MVISPLKKTGIGAGAVIILLIFLHAIGALTPFETFVRNLFTSSTSFFYDWRAALTANSSTRLASAEDYRKQNEKIAALTADFQEMFEENASLRSILDFKKSQPGKLVVAEVVGKPVLSGQDFLLINRGSDDGITVGQPVLTDTGLLAALVVKSEPEQSYIRLVSDGQSKVAALILNKDQSEGVVEGGYGLSLQMSFIPRNESVLVGDQVITSGLDDLIPRGILIGSVAAVENESYEPFQQAVLTPAAEFSKLYIVGVLTAPK